MAAGNLSGVALTADGVVAAAAAAGLGDSNSGEGEENVPELGAARESDDKKAAGGSIEASR